MTALWFGQPHWLWPGIAAALLAAGGIAAAFVLARRRARLLLGSASLVGWGTGLRDAALWLALVAVLAAGLGPRFGRSLVRISTSGVDLVVLLDLSRSMDATDIAPSRLDRARRAGRDVLARLPAETRAALAAFAGRGVLFTPLTPDHAALSELLPGVETDIIRPGGSNLAQGIDAAIEAYERGSHRPRVLLVMSDGETLDRGGDSGETALRRAGVRVIAATLGSPLGSTIPDHGAPLRDGVGEIVVSRRHDETLQRLARATDGQLFASDSFGRFDIDTAVAAIHRDAMPVEVGFIERATTVPVVWPFAALAFALLWLEALAVLRWRFGARVLAGGRSWLMQLRRDEARSAVSPGRRVAALAPLLLLVAAGGEPTSGPSTEDANAEHTIATLEAQARVGPLTARELIELGVARAQLERDDADPAFRAAAFSARSLEVAAVAYHNLGVGALARGELETARDAFFDALALPSPVTGNRAETRFNLEWTLAALRGAAEERPPPRRPERDEDGVRQGPLPQPEPDEPGDEDSPSTEADLESERESEAKSERDAAPPLPRSEREQRAKAPGTGSTPDTPVAGSEAPPPLSDSERRQWLQRVEDDPSRALLSAVAADRSQPDERAKRGGPTW